MRWKIPIVQTIRKSQPPTPRMVDVQTKSILILSTISKPINLSFPFSPTAAIYQLMFTGSDFAAPGLVEADNAAEPTPRVLIILAFVLDRLVARNDRLVNEVSQQLEELGCCSSSSNHLGNSFNAFHGVRAPSISILKYLERIFKYTNCSPSCLVVGFVYIDRLIHRHPDSLVISLNVHRLLVTSVMVASKMLDDVHYNNAFYARVGGVSKGELNKLELEMLFLLDFGVTVSSRAFETYCWHLEKEMLLNGNGEMQRVERPLTMPTNTLDDVSEISVDDTLVSSSPP